MYDLDLKNKIILITGGSDGLGYASAELLSSEGANVVICGRRGDYLSEKAKIISEKTNNEVLPIQADVSKADDCKRLVEETISKFKKIDVLVNNAGASAAALFEDALFSQHPTYSKFHGMLMNPPLNAALSSHLFPPVGISYLCPHMQL